MNVEIYTLKQKYGNQVAGLKNVDILIYSYIEDILSVLNQLKECQMSSLESNEMIQQNAGRNINYNPE